MDTQRNVKTDIKREKCEDRQREIETDLGETERWHSEKRVWKWRDRQTDKQRDGQAEKWEDRYKKREMHRQTER
jgi:hypothetical protein